MQAHLPKQNTISANLLGAGNIRVARRLDELDEQSNISTCSLKKKSKHRPLKMFEVRLEYVSTVQRLRRDAQRETNPSELTNPARFGRGGQLSRARVCALRSGNLTRIVHTRAQNRRKAHSRRSECFSTFHAFNYGANVFANLLLVRVALYNPPTHIPYV